VAAFYAAAEEQHAAGVGEVAVHAVVFGLGHNSRRFSLIFHFKTNLALGDRVAPELAFDTGRGDLFVCRVAGNFLNTDVIASFEYAVEVLHTPLLMVLGHQSCGAVDAAIKSIGDGTTLPGHLPSLVEAISPAVKATAGKPGNPLDNAIKQNVLLNVEKLKAATPIVETFVSEKKVQVVGAVYHLENGHIELLG